MMEGGDDEAGRGNSRPVMLMVLFEVVELEEAECG